MSEEVNKFSCAQDFIDGRMLLFDKALGISSFGVVKKVRWLLKEHLGIKKLKVGHAGTLDPLASGLLVLCTGKMTKQIQNYIDDDKEYTGTFFFGKTTPSFDAETEEEGDFSISHLSPELVEKCRLDFLGEQKQVPPIYSAKKIDGQRAYVSARKGQEVKMRTNIITIHEFDLPRIELPEIDFRVRCSKGTYIRSLANDFGLALDSGAYLSKLRRTRSGKFSVENAFSIDSFIKSLEELQA